MWLCVLVQIISEITHTKEQNMRRKQTQCDHLINCNENWITRDLWLQKPHAKVGSLTNHVGFDISWNWRPSLAIGGYAFQKPCGPKDNVHSDSWGRNVLRERMDHHFHKPRKSGSPLSIDEKKLNDYSNSMGEGKFQWVLFTNTKSSSRCEQNCVCIFYDLSSFYNNYSKRIISLEVNRRGRDLLIHLL